MCVTEVCRTFQKGLLFVSFPGDAVTVYPSETDVMIGNTITLYCNTTGECHAPPVIKWYHSQDKIVNVQNDFPQRLVLNATSVQQSGSYLCCIPSEDGSCTLSEEANIEIKGEYMVMINKGSRSLAL